MGEIISHGPEYGKCPVEEFLNDLRTKQAKKLIRV